MKTTMSAALALLLAGAAYAAQFGEAMPEAGEVIALGQALASPDAHFGERLKYTGRITDVCQKKGCWLVLTDGPVYARVMMRDHGFSVPKDASGEAIVYGELQRVERSAADQAHLEREGRGEVRANEYQIIADGVSIPRSS